MQKSNGLNKWVLSIGLMILTNYCLAQVYQSTNSETIIWANNVAAIGSTKEYSGKVLLAYRSQWGQDSPYRDIFAAYQYRFGGLSIGAKIIREDAGEASLARTRIVGDLAYQKKLNHEGDLIGVGISGGFMQSRITAGPLKFDNQYTLGEGFNPQSESGEMLSDADRMKPIFDAGFVFKKHFFASNITIGLSAQNLNNFIGDGEADVVLQPILYTLYSKYQIEFYERFKAEAFVGYQKYASVNDPMFLLSGRYEINDDYECIFGLGKRLHNTIMGQLGMRWRNVEINLGFDFANTRLPFSSSVIELGGSYTFKSK